MGHVKAADDKGFGMTINPSEMSEEVIPRRYRNKKGELVTVAPDDDEMAYIHGGGFAMEDKLSDAFGKEGNLANALYKALYLLDFPNKAFGRDGDFRGMGRRKGKSAKDTMMKAIAATTIFDVLKAADVIGDRNDLSFMTFEDGTPGLKYTRRF